MDTLLYWIGLVAVAVSALTGVLDAVRLWLHPVLILVCALLMPLAWSGCRRLPGPARLLLAGLLAALLIAAGHDHLVWMGLSSVMDHYWLPLALPLARPTSRPAGSVAACALRASRAMYASRPPFTKKLKAASPRWSVAEWIAPKCDLNSSQLCTSVASPIGPCVV